MFDEQEFHLRDYLVVIKKWRWLIVAVMLPVVAFSTFMALRSVPVYQATGRLLIERSTPNIVSFSDPGASNGYAWDPYLVETQINIIRSHAVAKRAIEKLGMMDEVLNGSVPASVETQTQQTLKVIRQYIAQIPRLLGAPEPPKVSETAKEAIAEERVVKLFLSMVSVSPVRESQLVDVRITHLEPEKAAEIANTLMDTYIEFRRDTKASTSRDAIRWLIDEMESAKQNLAQSEAALQAYKEEHAIISFEDRQNISMQKLSDMSEAVNAAKINRLSLETEYRELQRVQTGSVETIPQVISNPLIQQLKIKLMGLEAEYLELLEKFREKHPTAEALRTQIIGVQNQLALEIQRVFQSVRNQYELALAQEHTLTNALEEYKREALDLNQKATTYQILQKDIESNQRIYNELLQRVKETSVTERLETTNIQIVDRATIPTSSISASKRRNIMLSLIVGLALGIGAAFFLEYWNDKITNPDDFKKHLEVPLLAVIPTVKTQHIVKNEGKHGVEALVATIVLTDPQSTVSEAYRGLRTQVSFSELEDGGADTRCSILLVTSAEPSEGKSCTTSNLGIAMAQSGQKTLIIDCDFRKPKIGGIFHLDSRTFGFSDVMLSEPSAMKLLQKIKRSFTMKKGTFIKTFHF